MTINWSGVLADAWGRWKRDRQLLLPLAGLFLFLPRFAFFLLAPPIPQVSPDEAEDVGALLAPDSPIAAWLTHNAPGMFATMLLTAFGSLAILTLYLDPAAGTPGRALARAPRLFPRFLLAAIVAGLPAVPIAIRAVILILPGLYLLGRLLLVIAVIIAERPIGVPAAVARSVALTRRRGLAMMALAAALVLADILAPAPFDLLRALLETDRAGNPVAIAVIEALSSIAAAVVALAALLIQVALYRRLSRSISGT